MIWYFLLFIPLLITVVFTIYNIYKEDFITQTIPRYIFQTIRDKNDVNNDIKTNINYLRKKNPTYRYFLYDDNDCIYFIKNNYNKEIFDLYMTINSNYGPAKADLFRYLLMYKYGGIYLDIKSSCDVSFSDIITVDDKYILSYWSENGHKSSNYFKNFYGEFQQWHIICVPNHPFLKNVINEVINNIKNYDINKDGVGKDMVLKITGPYAYTKAILPILYNHDYTLYKTHTNIKLVYQNFNHILYFGKKHYTYCTEPLIKNDF